MKREIKKKKKKNLLNKRKKKKNPKIQSTFPTHRHSRPSPSSLSTFYYSFSSHSGLPFLFISDHSISSLRKAFVGSWRRKQGQKKKKQTCFDFHHSTHLRRRSKIWWRRPEKPSSGRWISIAPSRSETHGPRPSDLIARFMDINGVGSVSDYACRLTEANQIQNSEIMKTSGNKQKKQRLKWNSQTLFSIYIGQGYRKNEWHTPISVLHVPLIQIQTKNLDPSRVKIWDAPNLVRN